MGCGIRRKQLMVLIDLKYYATRGKGIVTN